MAKIKGSNFIWNWWYPYVAHGLLELIQDLRNDIAGKNGAIEILLQEKHDLHIELLAERIRRRGIEEKRIAIAPDMQCVLVAREHAATQRIRELESEVERMKAKLAKFHQK